MRRRPKPKGSDAGTGTAGLWLFGAVWLVGLLALPTVVWLLIIPTGPLWPQLSLVAGALMATLVGGLCALRMANSGSSSRDQVQDTPLGNSLLSPLGLCLISAA